VGRHARRLGILITQRPIAQDLAALPKTVQLALAPWRSRLCGITLGVLSAIGREAPSTASPCWCRTLAFHSGYWVGLLLILLFAVALRWSAVRTAASRIWYCSAHLGMRSIAFLARMTRRPCWMCCRATSSARSPKGLSEAAVILRHGFRNALIPVITVIGLDTGATSAVAFSPRRSSDGPASAATC